MNQTTTRTSQTEQPKAPGSRPELDGPRIYVACLAAYNSGFLHGEWIDADQDLEEVQEAIEQMLSRSPEPGAEEHAIHDFGAVCRTERLPFGARVLVPSAFTSTAPFAAPTAVVGARTWPTLSPFTQCGRLGAP